MKQTHLQKVGWLMFVSFSFASLVLLSSCASTKITATWSDARYRDQNILENSLVIAMVKDETIRRLYEDAFVKKLAENNIKATPSYTLSEPDIKPVEAGVLEAVKEAGARSVLITRHVSTDTKQQYQPPERVALYNDPYYSRVGRYYPLAYREVYNPGYTVTYTTVKVEANLYDAGTEKLVWSAQSESTDPQMTETYINELVQVYFEDLKKDGLL